MFGIGFPELVIILVLIVLVVGPEQLPDVARKAVSFLRQARRHLTEIKDAVDRETEPLRQPLQDVQRELNAAEAPPVVEIPPSVVVEEKKREEQT
ncbi:MAG: Sec-independent protein translocase protein TatB [Mariprofundaceae bacterium]